jgi:hypothetical protein
MRNNWFLTGLAGLALAGSAAAAEMKWQFKSSDISTLHLELDAGALSVVAANGPDVTVTPVEGYSPQRCDLVSEVKDRRLYFSVKAKKSGWRSMVGSLFSCKPHFRVEAPATTRVEATAGSGRMSVTGFSAGAVLRSGAGSIELDNLSGPVSAESGVGRIAGSVYSEEFSAKTGVGGVEVSWNKPPRKGKAKIEVGVGGIELSFPADTRLNSTYRGFGGHTSELEEAAGGFEILANVGVGGMNIKKTGAVTKN